MKKPTVRVAIETVGGVPRVIIRRGIWSSFTIDVKEAVKLADQLIDLTEKVQE